MEIGEISNEQYFNMSMDALNFCQSEWVVFIKLCITRPLSLTIIGDLVVNKNWSYLNFVDLVKSAILKEEEASQLDTILWESPNDAEENPELHFLDDGSIKTKIYNGSTFVVVLKSRM